MRVVIASNFYSVQSTTLRNKISIVSPQESAGHCGWHLVLARGGGDCDWLCSGLFDHGISSYASMQKLIERVDLWCSKAAFTNNQPRKKEYHGFLKRAKILSQKHADFLNGLEVLLQGRKIWFWIRMKHGEMTGQNWEIGNFVFNNFLKCILNLENLLLHSCDIQTLKQYILFFK